MKPRAKAKTAGLAMPIIAAAFCGVAHAQSNVTIYGNIDIGIRKETGTGATLGRGYNNWLGIKGAEDLGGGLAATFHLQTRFIPETGAQERPSTFWQGESTVGLASARVGSVRLGRALTPLWDSIWAFEPWSNSGFNASLAAYQTGSYSSDGVNDVALGFANLSRIANGVFYDSPDFAGFQLSIAGQVAKDAAARTRNIGTALNFDKGAIKAMLSYERNQNSEHIYFVGASYAVGSLTLMGSYARTNLTTVSERLAVIAATYALGADTVRVGYGRHSENGNQKLGLGYVHPLSKRTNLYADVYHERSTRTVTGFALGASHTF